ARPRAATRGRSSTRSRSRSSAGPTRPRSSDGPRPPGAPWSIRSSRAPPERPTRSWSSCAPTPTRGPSARTSSCSTSTTSTTCACWRPRWHPTSPRDGGGRSEGSAVTAAVLFDFYGTLARATAWGATHDEVLARHGYEPAEAMRGWLSDDGLYDGQEHH